jgi:hypothetical protein
VNGFSGEVRELLEILVGLASRAGWRGAARVTRDGDDYLIALRVRRRPVELETILQKRGASIMRSAGDRRGAGRLAHGVEAA